jgi:hypothetical protein
MLMFCPGGLFAVEGSSDDAEDESASDGLANAAQGVAATPTPIPSATANAPTRPICLAYPVAVYCALPIVVPPPVSGRDALAPVVTMQFCDSAVMLLYRALKVPYDCLLGKL